MFRLLRKLFYMTLMVAVTSCTTGRVASETTTDAAGAGEPPTAETITAEGPKTATATTAEGPKTPNVVLLVIDGTRQLETIGDSTHTHIPHIWGDLLPQGALIPNFRNQGQTKTNPGHSSILSGTWQQIANDGSERPTEPTLFEYYRRYGGVPASEVQLVSGKGKLKAVAWSTAPGYGKRYGATASVGIYGDRAVYERLIAYSSATNDHGRHVEPMGFQHHGCTCEGCERLLFVALGPDIKHGYVAPPDLVYTQRDLCNTVARILDFPVERSQGRVIEEIFAAEE